MKSVSTFLAVSCMGLLVLGCKRHGCMEKDANNFDSKATNDDGTCDYDDPPGAVSLTVGFDCTTKRGIDFSEKRVECDSCSSDTFSVSTDIIFSKDKWRVIAGDSCWGAGNLGIVSLGQVCCLGAIKEIPTSGFSGEVPPAIHDGYVVRTREGKHARMFIVDYVIGSFGNIEGAKLRVEYPFEP